MARTVSDLTSADLEFMEERHLATLTTLRADGSPHVVAIAFMFDQGAGLVRIICRDGGQKVRNIERSGRAVVCQVDGRRWLSLEGEAVVTRDPARIAAAEAAFAQRYRTPQERADRVAIEIEVTRILGRSG
jgi:PPOX class probable F420-dependent enzyme